MKKRYFGTDGIRGRANQYPINGEEMLKLSVAVGTYFKRNDHRHRAVIGKDTRLSGYMIETSLTAGLLSAGIDVILVGPVPTPAVSMLTRSMRADLGIMISASHNQYYDNGIKLFDQNGGKLSDDDELEIEKIIDRMTRESMASCGFLVDAVDLGRARRFEDARGRYIEFVKNSFPKDLTLTGLKVVIDAANGAAYQIAPEILWELGAEVVTINASPNGENINLDCGAMHPEKLAERVLAENANIGIALDGDADRLVLVDELGKIVHGDEVIALISSTMSREGKLRGPVVITQMSNLGLENYLTSLGLDVIRTDVGDRYILAAMETFGSNFGAEQSGHIILGDYAKAGDGIVSSLEVLAAMKRNGKSLSNLTHNLQLLDQTLCNIAVENVDHAMNNPKLKTAAAVIEQKLQGKGRLLLRKSGTESVIRIMIEAMDATLVQESIELLRKVVLEECNLAMK